MKQSPYLVLSWPSSNSSVCSIAMFMKPSRHASTPRYSVPLFSLTTTERPITPLRKVAGVALLTLPAATAAAAPSPEVAAAVSAIVAAASCRRATDCACGVGSRRRIGVPFNKVNGRFRDTDVARVRKTRCCRHDTHVATAVQLAAERLVACCCVGVVRVSCDVGAVSTSGRVVVTCARPEVSARRLIGGGHRPRQRAVSTDRP